MAQFDVFRIGKDALLVLDCQADILAALKTRVVVPLIPLADAPKPARNLNPVFEIDGARYYLAAQQLSAVELKELGDKVGSLAAQRREIVNALDFLLTGV